MRAVRWVGIVGLGLLIAGGCSSDDDKGDNGGSGGAGATAGDEGGAATAGGGGSAAEGGVSAAGGTAAIGGGGDGGPCVPATCQGKTYQCGDCIDNDGDGKIDMDDPDCLGPCDNNELGFALKIPGGDGPACTVDCYFDQDSGAGNDKCCWDHRCDPLSVAPHYPPEGPGNTCAYAGTAEEAVQSKIPALKTSCSQSNCDVLYDKAKGGQDPICENFCGPLTPNGCDCFGCCELPAHSGSFVWLGSVINKVGSCDLASVGDPTKCQPCTPVASCLNECLKCELCLGKTELPAECFPPPPDAGVGGSPGTGGTSGTGGTPASGGSSGSCGGQICPVGAQPCGLSCQPPCPNGFFCKTGCCTAVPS
jgi:hypothetical protein